MCGGKRQWCDGYLEIFNLVVDNVVCVLKQGGRWGKVQMADAMIPYYVLGVVLYNRFNSNLHNVQ